MPDPRLQGFDGINAMLHRFGEYQQWPKFKFQLSDGETLRIKLLKGGKNAGGASLEMQETGDWLGYILTDGTYQPNRNAHNLEINTKKALWNLMKGLRDTPQETFAEHGIRTGNCCACGRTLTAEESVDLGMGPVCRERLFG